jgi:NADP-dependent 3-hydroxy acid dehydrogenase YdfG
MPAVEFNMKPLQDQVAVVTGAGSGIGKAIALRLGEFGASLVLVGRRLELLDRVADSLNANGAKAVCYSTDLADRSSVQSFAASFRRDQRKLDVLVHSAGMVRQGRVAEASADDFEALFRTNVLGPYLLTQELLPLLGQTQGQVVFINSSVGLAAKAGVGQYAATKHALKAVADSLRAEVNTQGIRVLSVYPGRTATPTQEILHVQEQRPYLADRLLQPEDVADAVVNSLCLPRTAELTDLHIRPMSKPD